MRVIPLVKAKPQYLAGDKGRKRGVLLSIKEYTELLRRLEDLEDALELDEVIRTAQGFRGYREIQAELKKEGLF